MPKITALSNIKHNGKDYAAGDVLEVNKSDADYLVKLGAAEAGGAAEKKPTAAEAKALAEAEAKALAEAEAKALAEAEAKALAEAEAKEKADKEAADKAAADADATKAA